MSLVAALPTGNVAFTYFGLNLIYHFMFMKGYEYHFRLLKVSTACIPATLIFCTATHSATHLSPTYKNYALHGHWALWNSIKKA